MACEVLVKAINGLLTGFFLIVSVAFITYGITSTLTLLITNSEEILKEEYTALSSCLIAAFGILLFLFVLLGCCSICRETPCCIETYSIFLTILAIAQIGLGVFCLVRFTPKNYELERAIETDVVKMFTQYPNIPGPMDDLQSTLECCGVHNPDDWRKAKHLVPKSCCPMDVVATNCTWFSKDRYRFGCKDNSLRFILGTNFIIGWCLLAVGVIEVFAAILGLCMSCAYWRPRL